MKIKNRLFSFIMIKWYNYLSGLDSKGEVTFLNYGYYDGKNVKLKKIDEKNRYCIHLYNKVVSSINLKNKKVLEVGCGRGGGACYIARYHKPESIVGLDYSKEEIKFNKSHYNIKNLNFIYGDAMALPFQSESFDAIINIESSHSYIDFDKFLKEAKRVLKQGGYFLFADFRNKGSIKKMLNSLENSGMEITKKQDISKNIFDSLNKDDKRRVNLIKKFLPKFLYKIAENFAGVPGSRQCNSFNNGKKQYYYFVLRKR